MAEKNRGVVKYGLKAAFSLLFSDFAEVLYNYAKNLAQETKEIFAGPESVRSEVIDLLVLAKLFCHWQNKS